MDTLLLMRHEAERLLKMKSSLQWKNDWGLYLTLVLVMKIGMCDLMTTTGVLTH